MSSTTNLMLNENNTQNGVPSESTLMHTEITPKPSKETTNSIQLETETAPEKNNASTPKDYDFKTPEGVTQLDQQTLDIFTPVAKALALTQEQAQTLVNIYPEIQARQAEAWAIQSAEWAQQVREDRDIGGDNFDANIGRAQKALDQFGNQDLRQYLEASGLGNHPALVRFCVNVGKAMSEDNAIVGDKVTRRNLAQILYEN